MPHHYHFARLDSTQTYLLNHPNTSRPIFCRADSQSAGKGQRGAHWQSPPNSGLYFSLKTTLPYPLATHNGLAQMVALTLAQTLDPSAEILTLKWPNDLYIGTQKLGGILIDLHPDGENSIAVIGIGINLRADAQRPDTANLYAHFPENPTLYPELCQALLNSINRWQETPYLPTDHRWNDYDRFQGQIITLESHPNPVKNLGIDQKGRLTIISENGIEFLSNTRIKI